MASSADMHNQLTTQYAPADDLPCGNFALLVPLKKSPDYRTIRPRIANHKAIDSWQEEGLHFFVFELKPTPGAAIHPSDLPVAVFTMHPEEPAPISVVVVTPRADGAEAEVLDLRQPDSVYTAPYVGNGHAAEQPNGDEASQQGDAALAGALGVEQTPGSGPTLAEPDSVDAPIVIAGPPAAVIVASAAPTAPPAYADREAPSLGNVDEVDGVGESSLDVALVLTDVQTHDEPIVGQQSGGDDGLVADAALLIPLKQSTEYQALAGRVANAEPVDAWQEDDLHFFSFELQAMDMAANGHAQPPLAVFAMAPAEPMPVSAVVVAPGTNGEEVEIFNLRAPEAGRGRAADDG